MKTRLEFGKQAPHKQKGRIRIKQKNDFFVGKTLFCKKPQFFGCVIFWQIFCWFVALN